ncbi:TIR domain-containing protein [Halobaculum lipolyticum]|uniref:TIR domain-containing protein n=1 Tax=Halobaculum lipolyticum TaxID=3032001 RepID=A0ABD5WBZ7_9EURY
MTWTHAIRQAERSNSPVSVAKNEVTGIPRRFEKQGLGVEGLWGVYTQRDGTTTITIREYLHKYQVETSPSDNGGPTDQVVPRNKGIDLGGLQQTAGSNQALSKTQAAAGTAAAGGLGFVGWLLYEALSGSKEPQSPDPKTAHRVFVSHSWTYEDQYAEITDLLNDARGFEYFDHSVSSDEPLDARLPEHLRKKFRDQIQGSSVVLITAGMYVTESQAIQDEIDIAAEMDKPIIGVIPEGNQRVPTLVRDHADELVTLDRREIQDAIEEHSQ